MITRRRLLAASGLALIAGRLPRATAESASPSGWMQAASLPIRTQELYPAVHQGRLWVSGGIASRLAVPYFSAATFAYDAGADRWSEEAALPESRHHAAMVSTGNRLFIAGGFNASYTRVWQMRSDVLELGEAGWERIGSMPTAQAEGVLAHHGDGIVHLVTGQSRKGNANSERSDHTEIDAHWRWDTAGDTWERAAPILTPRNSATGGWIDNQLIVAGGRTSRGNLDVTEIYDAREDRWRTGAPMPLPQAGTASVLTGDALIVFGGEIFSPKPRVFPNVWQYRPEADAWEALPDMPTPRHGIGAGLIGNKAYVIGGATEPGGSGTSDANEALLLGDTT